jgi:hypothetical protein
MGYKRDELRLDMIERGQRSLGSTRLSTLAGDRCVACANVRECVFGGDNCLWSDVLTKHLY